MRPALIGFFGLLLIVPSAACGSATSNHRPYDAGATYKCLKKRPELRPWDWEPGFSKIPPPPSGIVLKLSPKGIPFRFTKSFVPALRVRGNGPGSALPIEFDGKLSISILPSILVFDQTAAAASTYRGFFLASKLNGDPASAIAFQKEEYVLRRNAVIDFMIAPDAMPNPKEARSVMKQIRAIVFGCLRSR